MAFQIVTDSCCDFTDAEYKAMNVACVPLSVMWDGQCHNHFSNESELKAFYQQMRNGLIATTSALNPDNWARAMEPFLKEGKDLLVIAVSSGISTTYQSAMIAAADLREAYPQRVIQVVDSLSGSLGEGLLLWHACRMCDAGETLSNAAAWLRDHCRRICHWVTVNDLSNLKRSGRLSSAGAIVGTMLDIKPIIKVTEEGKLVSDTKVRGRRASIRMLAQKFAEYRSDSEEDLVTIAHGDCPEDAEALAAILKNEYGVKHILKGYVGPVLGAHTGPGVLGLFHIGTQR
ncbi:MAG: DegV family protein [Oscillospiraceae bacterium]|nr:DegV family protein [Oscillospiraceae bacterium]